MLYVGVTNSLQRRVYEHKEGLVAGYTKKYNVKKLVYYEEFDNIMDAITAEKIIKGWKRDKKNKLIDSVNKEWEDLSYSIW